MSCELEVAIVASNGDRIFAKGRRVFVSPFDIGDKVSVDGGDIAATVIGFAVYAQGTEVLVSWWSAGDLKQAWVHDTRLSLIEAVS